MTSKEYRQSKKDIDSRIDGAMKILQKDADNVAKTFNNTAENDVGNGMGRIGYDIAKIITDTAAKITVDKAMGDNC